MIKSISKEEEEARIAAQRTQIIRCSQLNSDYHDICYVIATVVNKIKTETLSYNLQNFVCIEQYKTHVYSSHLADYSLVRGAI